MGPVLGPPYPHHPCPGHTGNGSWLPAPSDRQPREGQRLKPDAPQNDGRPTPPGRPPTTLAARSPSQGMQATGIVLGPHARTPVPTASGWRTPTARPEAGQPRGRGGAWPQTPLTTAQGTPPGTPSRRPHSAQRRLARVHAVVVSPPCCRNHPCPAHTGNGSWLRAPRDGRPEEGQRLIPDAPHNGGRPPSKGRPPTTSAARSPAQDMQAKGKVLGPHTRTPAPAASG